MKKYDPQKKRKIESRNETNLALERLEKGPEEIKHPCVHHHRLLAFGISMRRIQSHVADCIKSYHASPTWIRSAGRLDAGESNVHDAADSLRHET